MRLPRRLIADETGAAAIEFAILAPLIITMLLGVLAVGVQMQNYNAVRNVAGDVGRYTIVEYQKSNKLSADQIRDVATAIAESGKYNLQPENLDVQVVLADTAVANAKQFQITVTYQAPDLLPDGMRKTLSLTCRQSVIVPVDDDA